MKKLPMCPMTIRDGRARKCVGPDCAWWVVPTITVLSDSVEDSGELLALPVEELPGKCAIAALAERFDP